MINFIPNVLPKKKEMKKKKKKNIIFKTSFKKKDVKESSPSRGILCYEYNGHGHLKKECPNYLRGNGKVLTTTLSDSERSNLDSEEECNSDGN